MIKNRDPSQMIIIDNSISSFASNLENGIYVPSYNGEADDSELEIISSFLCRIATVPDVRPHVIKFAGIIPLFEEYLSEIIK